MEEESWCSRLYLEMSFFSASCVICNMVDALHTWVLCKNKLVQISHLSDCTKKIWMITVLKFWGDHFIFWICGIREYFWRTLSCPQYLLFLATSSPLWTYAASHSHMNLIHDGFCQFSWFTSSFWQKTPIRGKMESLNNHRTCLMAIVLT